MGLRKERMADEVRDLLGACFLGGQMNDPRLEGISITHVKLSADLQVATVYYRLFDQSKKTAVEDGLKRVRGFLRSHLASNLRTRRVPDLRFFYDESVEYGSHIESLLSQIRAEATPSLSSDA